MSYYCFFTVNVHSLEKTFCLRHFRCRIQVGGTRRKLQCRKPCVACCEGKPAVVNIGKGNLPLFKTWQRIWKFYASEVVTEFERIKSAIVIAEVYFLIPCLKQIWVQWTVELKLGTNTCSQHSHNTGMKYTFGPNKHCPKSLLIVLT